MDVVNWDVWIIKLDHEGNKLWDKTFGGSGMDGAYSLIQTTDGGYTVTGRTESKGAGGADVWIIKLDEQGNLGEILEEEPISTKVFDVSEEKIVITSVINNFSDTINNHDWVQSKKYCVTGSQADLVVDEAKDSIEKNYSSDKTMNFEIIISDIDILDDINAKADCTLKIIITRNGEIIEEDSPDAIMLLENIGNQWKIYEINPR